VPAVASVPGNWTSLTSSQSVKYVPPNGYGELNGQTVFTHGIEFGVAKAASRDLRAATDTWLNAVRQGNPDMRIAGEQMVARLSQRSALATPLANPSPLGGAERITVYTTFLADGNLFYYLTVAPEVDATSYEAAFERVARSLRLIDAR